MTIEERATETLSSIPSLMFRKGYIAGAKEQKEIDIDKVIKWLGKTRTSGHRFDINVDITEYKEEL